MCRYSWTDRNVQLPPPIINYYIMSYTSVCTHFLSAFTGVTSSSQACAYRDQRVLSHSIFYLPCCLLTPVLQNHFSSGLDAEFLHITQVASLNIKRGICTSDLSFPDAEIEFSDLRVHDLHGLPLDRLHSMIHVWLPCTDILCITLFMITFDYALAMFTLSLLAFPQVLIYPGAFSHRLYL